MHAQYGSAFRVYVFVFVFKWCKVDFGLRRVWIVIEGLGVEGLRMLIRKAALEGS